MKILLELAIISVGFLTMGCSAFRESGSFENKWGRHRTYSELICDGRGLERPLFSQHDYFTHYIKFLKDSDSSFRGSIAHYLSTDCHIAGMAFHSLLDAYIVGGRDDQLEAALLDAWQKEKPNTSTRRRMADAYCEIRRRQYLWAHPEFGRSLGLAKDPEKSRSKNDLWWGFNRLHRDAIDAELAKLGDKDFDRVRKNYSDLLDALKAGTLLN